MYSMQTQISICLATGQDMKSFIGLINQFLHIVNYNLTSKKCSRLICIAVKNIENCDSCFIFVEFVIFVEGYYHLEK